MKLTWARMRACLTISGASPMLLNRRSVAVRMVSTAFSFWPPCNRKKVWMLSQRYLLCCRINRMYSNFSNFLHIWGDYYKIFWLHSSVHKWIKLMQFGHRYVLLILIHPWKTINHWRIKLKWKKSNIPPRIFLPNQWFNFLCSMYKTYNPQTSKSNE